ncbi:PLP-dependent aminotransferase family protein [Halioxenophilus sp. WMMB6]|uniref:aminotransferase-like domain-containing protein n=1 Tax=Halioxenophilus sp. WMMB6 TaxID=3073815 RepID=UPI00295E428C|nr:PLP-dependent aminotransferase family protein [Halioxenophilus sp. WMMB6]
MASTKYEKLVNELTRAIQSGGLAPGAKLPSVRELMRQQQLSLATVTTALTILEEQGLIEPKARSGYFVRNEQPSRLRYADPHFADRESGYHWWPDGDLYPKERLRKLTATMIRRYPNLHTFSPRNNNPRLVRQLITRAAEIGCYTTAEEVLITHGLIEALSVVLRSLTAPREKVLLQHPTSPVYQAVCDALKLQPVYITSNHDEKQFLANLEQILAEQRELKTLLLACNFHCPTSDLISLAGKRSLLKIAGQYDLTIIEDDSSGDLHFENSRPLPLKALDEEKRVIYLSAATHSFAPGIQVGWIFADRQRLQQFEDLKSVSTCAVDQLPQLVLAEFLDQGSHLPHLRKLCGALKERVQLFESLMQPCLAACQGLTGRSGGFNRFLRRSDIAFDHQLEKECKTRWPKLFSIEHPFFHFLDSGISANLSLPIDETIAQELRQFAEFLANLNCELAS